MRVSDVHTPEKYRTYTRYVLSNLSKLYKSTKMT